MSNLVGKNKGYHNFMQKTRNNREITSFVMDTSRIERESLNAKDTKIMLEKMMQKETSYNYMESIFKQLYEYKEKIYWAETFLSERNKISENKVHEALVNEMDNMDEINVKILTYLFDHYEKEEAISEKEYFQGLIEVFNSYKENGVTTEKYSNYINTIAEIQGLSAEKDTWAVKLKAVDKLRKKLPFKKAVFKENEKEYKELLIRTLNSIFVKSNEAARIVGYKDKIDKACNEQMKINKLFTMKNQIRIKSIIVDVILGDKITDRYIKASQGYRMIEAALRNAYGEEYTKIAMGALKNGKTYKTIRSDKENYCGTFARNFDKPDNYVFSSAPITFSDLYPLIHELGHYVYYEMNPNKLKLENMRPNGYLTEVQSILNELILLDHLTLVARNEKTRQLILKNFIYIEYDSLNDSLEKGLFECECLRKITNNSTYEDYENIINKLQLKTNKLYELVDNCGQENFESLKYVNAFAIAVRIRKNMIEGGKEYTDKYIKNMHFIPEKECLANIDIDLNDNSMYFDVIKYFNKITNQIEGFKKEEIYFFNQVNAKK